VKQLVKYTIIYLAGAISMIALAAVLDTTSDTRR
jgi:hypothetical protein